MYQSGEQLYIQLMMLTAACQHWRSLCRGLKRIYSSVPEDWHSTLATLGLAYDAYHWVLDQFIGSYNLKATERWKAELEKGTQPGKTLAQYVRRMLDLQQCLKGNGHIMQDRESRTSVLGLFRPRWLEGVRPCSDFGTRPKPKRWVNFEHGHALQYPLPKMKHDFS